MYWGIIMLKNNKSLKIVSLVLVITIFAKVLGFLRILFMAKTFGTGIEASAFEAAYKIPNILFTSVGVAISTTFIPIFTEYLSKKGKKEAVFFANNVTNILLLLTMVIAIIGMIFAPIIVKLIYMGFSGPIYDLTVDLVRIMFPIIILIAISFIFVGVLQSFGEFNIPAGISIPSNIINIIYLIFFSYHWGIYGFAIAILLGWITQLLYQIPSLLKNDYKYKFVISFKHEGIKKMLIMVIPIILGSSVQQINAFVDGALASNLSDSAVSALSYGFNLYIIIGGVFTYAISAVIFPSLSKMHSSCDYENFTKITNNALKSIIIIIIPIMFGIFVLNVPIIKTLLERGKFNFESTIMTSSVLLFYSIGMLGFGIQEILNKSFYALQNTKTPMKISVLGMIINIVLSLIFVNLFGISGLALATSIASIFIAIALLYKLSIIIPNLLQRETIITFFKILICSIIMGIWVHLTYTLLLGKVNLLINLFSSITSGGIIYYLSALIIKVDEAKILINYVKSKMIR